MSEDKEIVYLQLDEFLNSKKVELYEAITNEYPIMDKEETDRLVYDIRKNGIVSPLLAIKRDNKYLIVDGRNRYNALKDLNSYINDKSAERNEKEKTKINELKNIISIIPLEIIEDTDIDSLRIIADSLNLSRRHLSPAQKSIIAFSERLKEQREYFNELARKNKNSGKRAKNKILKIAALAEMTGGNKEYTQRWKKVEDFFTKTIYDDNNKEVGKKYINKDKLDKLKRIAYNDSKRYQTICSIFRFPKNSVDFFDIVTRNKILEVIDEVIKNYELDKPKNISINKLKKEKKLPISQTTTNNANKGKLHDLKAGEMGVYLNFRLEKDQMERLTMIIKKAFEEELLPTNFELWFLSDDNKKAQISDTIKNIAANSIDVIKSTDFNSEAIPNEDN